MSKKPTPKRHLSKSRTRSRYSSFASKARKRLGNLVNLVDCSNCHQKRKSHYACPTCGFYRGRKVMDVVKVKKAVQKIKA